MTFDEAKVRIRELAAMTLEEQKARSDEITMVFEVYWRSAPTRREFSQDVSGLLLTPAVLFTMVSLR